jgi:hypothetical protein
VTAQKLNSSHVDAHLTLHLYKKPQSKRWRTMSLDVMEFMRRFLQHVLPSGFVKVLYYGFLRLGISVPLEKIEALIELSFGFQIVKPEMEIEPFDPPTCSHCGGRLKYVTSIGPFKLIQSGAG